MHDVDLILTLTAGLTAALILGFITQQLRLSPIVGYLLAGIAVGPHTPGFAADASIAQQLAEVGVILLMFGVGLNFHIRELLEVRSVAIPGALVASSIATVLGMGAAHLQGHDWAAGIVFGSAISVASTVVLIRVLSDNRDLHTRSGHIAVGWVVVEDLLTVAALVVLPAIFGGEPLGVQGVAIALGTAALKIAALVAVILLVGGRLIPWVMEHVAATRSRELFTLAVLVIALGIAVGSAKLFGVSMALGAFLAGTIVGRSEFGLRAASEALPMRDAFAVLFFVSVGMLPEAAINTLVAAAMVSITLNPLLYRLIGPFERWLARFGVTTAAYDDADGLDGSAPSHRAIVVGYGPVGQTVTQLLLDNEIVPTVIELNLDTVRRLRAFYVRAIYGDATRPEILVEAGVKGADNLILTSGAGRVDEEIVRRAKELNPDVTILARSQYVRDLPKLHNAGAEDVFSAEGEVALAFTVRILERLGATGEQIDRERARVEATFRNG